MYWHLESAKGILPAVPMSNTHGTQLHVYHNCFLFINYKLLYTPRTLLLPKKGKKKRGWGKRSLTLLLHSPSSVFFTFFQCLSRCVSSSFLTFSFFFCFQNFSVLFFLSSCVAVSSFTICLLSGQLLATSSLSYTRLFIYIYIYIFFFFQFTY